MKKVGILGIVISLVALLAIAAPVMAKGPVGETITITWLEDATRYKPDSSILTSWTNDANGPADLVCTGKAYHFAEIGQFYNQTLPDVSGSVVISGAGKLSGHTTYTSLVSGLPIRERFRGNVAVDADAGIMAGTYTQWACAFGSAEDVLTYYPYAAPSEDDGWWFIGYTVYTAY